MGEHWPQLGVLVLVPFLLMIAVLWLLHRHPGGKGDETGDEWEGGCLPDADDNDDNEDHYLM